MYFMRNALISNNMLCKLIPYYSYNYSKNYLYIFVQMNVNDSVSI